MTGQLLSKKVLSLPTTGTENKARSLIEIKENVRSGLAAYDDIYGIILLLKELALSSSSSELGAKLNRFSLEDFQAAKLAAENRIRTETSSNSDPDILETLKDEAKEIHTHKHFLQLLEAALDIVRLSNDLAAPTIDSAPESESIITDSENIRPIYKKSPPFKESRVEEALNKVQSMIRRKQEGKLSYLEKRLHRLSNLDKLAWLKKALELTSHAETHIPLRTVLFRFFRNLMQTVAHEDETTRTRMIDLAHRIFLDQEIWPNDSREARTFRAHIHPHFHDGDVVITVLPEYRVAGKITRQGTRESRQSTIYHLKLTGKQFYLDAYFLKYFEARKDSKLKQSKRNYAENEALRMSGQKKKQIAQSHHNAISQVAAIMFELGQVHLEPESTETTVAGGIDVPSIAITSAAERSLGPARPASTGQRRMVTSPRRGRRSRRKSANATPAGTRQRRQRSLSMSTANSASQRRGRRKSTHAPMVSNVDTLRNGSPEVLDRTRNGYLSLA